MLVKVFIGLENVTHFFDALPSALSPSLPWFIVLYYLHRSYQLFGSRKFVFDSYA
jgi:hypothetical protein